MQQQLEFRWIEGNPFGIMLGESSLESIAILTDFQFFRANMVDQGLSQKKNPEITIGWKKRSRSSLYCCGSTSVDAKTLADEGGPRHDGVSIKALTASFRKKYSTAFWWKQQKVSPRRPGRQSYPHLAAKNMPVW